jgi:FAD/FMN-containing dehydrogenase
VVQPGIVLDDLNRQLKKYGLWFPVDVSTASRATIGGMAGNNSCGSKSIRYGLMADNVRAIDAILADGTQHKFGVLPDNIGAHVPSGIADLIQRLRVLGATEAAGDHQLDAFRARLHRRRIDASKYKSEWLGTFRSGEFHR